MKVAIIGCGAVARYCHAPALQRIKGVTIAAVADPDQTSRERLGRATGAALHESAASVLARDDIDAAIICVPPGMHADVAVEVAKSGRAFYLEKPVATSADDARRVVAEAARSGVPAAVGFNRRAHPLYERARALVAGGALGQVHSVHTVFSEPAPVDGLPEWKRARATGGGALLDLASHHFDLLRWLLGREIESVTAHLESVITEGDSASVTAALSDGATAQCFFSLRSALADTVEIIGDLATLRIDRHEARLSSMLPRRFGYGARERRVGGGLRDAGWRLRRVVHPAEDPSYYRALDAFVSQVRGERAALASLDDGVRSLEAVLAAEKSASTGVTVAVADPR